LLHFICSLGDYCSSIFSRNDASCENMTNIDVSHVHWSKNLTMQHFIHLLLLAMVGLSLKNLAIQWKAVFWWK